MAVSLKKTNRPISPQREFSTKLMAEIAFGDPMFFSSGEVDADAERAVRRARWQRRKSKRGLDQ